MRARRTFLFKLKKKWTSDLDLNMYNVKTLTFAITFGHYR